MTLEEFLVALEDTPRGWIFAKDAVVERGLRLNGHCPLTAVCEERTGKHLQRQWFCEAARALGLSDTLPFAIATAADFPSTDERSMRYPHTRELRKRLLKACGLPEEVDHAR